jgi:transcriptional regulator with XRE-family HTH domain
MDREELARSLIAARARLQPGDVGLPATRHRRVPGLRREEVAQLAGISVDYLVRLEQGRGPHPSAQVVGALARGLRLDEGEREHLFIMAGALRPPPGRVDRHVAARTSRLIDRLADVPVLVLDAIGELLAWNDLALALVGDFTTLPPGRRNILRMWFLDGGGGRVVYDAPEDEERAAVEAVADLRATAARYPDDPDVRRLVTDLLEGSSRFRQLWESARVETSRMSTKTIDHPVVGRLRLDCDVLLLPDTDQRLIVYSARPGTPDADALDLLRVVGLEHLDGVR